MPPATTLIGFVWAHNCCTPVLCRNAPAGVKASMATCSPEVVVETEGGAESSRGNQSVCDSIIRDGDVGKDFANGADPLARPPSVLFGGHGLGQGGVVALLVISGRFKEIGTRALRLVRLGPNSVTLP